jgi:phospholipid transport system substrate-binding protein
MGYRAAALLPALLVLAVLAPLSGAAAGEATDQIKADIEELYRAVSTAGAPAGRRIVDRMFDWSAMSASALRGHWQKRSPAERAEFTKLFSDLFGRAYLSRINLVDARSFEYLGDTTEGEKGTVKTKILTRRGSKLDVDYVVRATPEKRWQVQDVRVETMSLVDNYRVQFDSIIAKTSYEELVKRLRASVNK